MQNDREAGYSFLDFFQNVETQWRRYQYSFCIAGALFRTEFVRSVRCTYGNSKRIDTGFLYEVLDILRSRVGTVFCRYFVLNACEDSQFPFHGNVILMSVLYNPLGQCNVFFVWKRRTINHDRRKAVFYTGFAKFETVAVVKVQYYRNVATQFLRIFHGSLCHVS